MNKPRAFFELIKSQGQDTFVGPGGGSEVIFGSSGGAKESGFLMAILGDDSYESKGNKGLSTLEVCRIGQKGDIGAWSQQTAAIQGGQATLAMGALLYFDYMFTFGGVAKEYLDSDPSVQTSSASRFNFFDDPDPAPPENTILYGLQSTSASMADSVAYYQLLRLNGYNWLLGGNNGAGPTDLIQKTLQ